MDPTTNDSPTGASEGAGSVRDDANGASAGSAAGRGRGPDDQARAIARAVDRNARKTTELNDQVRRLGEDVARLVALVTTPPLIPVPAAPGDDPAAGEPVNPPGGAGEGEAGPPPVRSWLLASDPELAVADLADLVEWLDRVYLRYPGSELGACWLWHPHVIEELWWLRRAHAEAYGPDTGSWLRVGDWHDRQRPNVVRRVRDALGKCDLSLHAPGRQHGHAPAVAPLVAHAARIAVEWAATSTRSEPTAAQLAEAGDYAQAMHRRAR
ncbi:hypothetical protein [Pseudonocardia nigra]|uniref:hypothetical protein n=1 Tax=Pseudonocardia nigra TaxID=1921578 RepID=UPI001C60652A|nr:hypothetical protein [Pseudonocardia nigra]